MKYKTKRGVKYGMRRNNENITRPNQWTGSPQQEKFLMTYLDPKSETFANAYQSAVAVGYSKDYARILAMPSTNSMWLQEARDIIKLGPEHLTQAIQAEALDQSNKASDRLKALEMIAKMQGLFVEKKVVLNLNIEDALRELK